MTETFLAPLFKMLLRGGTAPSDAVPLYLVVFAAGCAGIALLVLFPDICVFVVTGWSFLRYRHGIVRLVIAAVLMPAAAGIVGIIGRIVRIDIEMGGKITLQISEAELTDRDGYLIIDGKHPHKFTRHMFKTLTIKGGTENMLRNAFQLRTTG